MGSKGSGAKVCDEKDYTCMWIVKERHGERSLANERTATEGSRRE
jgi:hypothetical protein